MRLAAVVPIVCLGLVPSCAVAQEDPPPTRRVEVRVTVTTDGPPFPAGTYVSMGVTQEIQVPDVPTDEDGRAVLIADVPADIETIVVGIPTVITWGSPDDLDVRDGAAHAADRAFSLPPPEVHQTAARRRGLQRRVLRARGRHGDGPGG